MNEEIRKDVQEWIDRSDYDLKTAEAMLGARRYVYVFFCCQQAVEKRLKAIVASRGKVPRKIHDLLRLSEDAGVANTERQMRLLENLNNLYIQSRYPGEAGALESAEVRETAERYLDQAREHCKWLDDRMISRLF